LFDDPPQDPHPPGWMYGDLTSNPLNEAEVEEVAAEFDRARHPYLDKFDHFRDLKPVVAQSLSPEPVVFNPEYLDTLAQDDDHDNHADPTIRAAIKRWKSQNPDRTIKEERAKLARGKIDQLPWMQLIADNELGREPMSGFGISFPANPVKGDTFMRVDQMPNVLYKFNGAHWIIVDKNLTDNYTYDDAYIEHLIAKLTSGEYDPDMLSDAEADAIARRVRPI
jgi:hypothetical protein